MKKIESYAVMWHVDHDEGSINLQLEDGTSRMIQLSSASEGSFITDILRNENPVYIHDNHNQIITGIEPVGEGEKEED